MQRRWVSSCSLNPICIKHDSEEVITAEKLKAELRRGLEQKTWEAVHEGTGREN